MQGVAGHLQPPEIVSREPLIRGASERGFVGPVQLVPDHRRSERREVHADLMLAARLEPAFHPSVARPPRPAADRGDLDPSGGVQRAAAVVNAHLDSQRMRQIELYGALVPKGPGAVAAVRHSPGQRDVRLLHAPAILDLLFELPVAFGSLRNDDDSARFPVQAMPEREKTRLGPRRLEQFDEGIFVMPRGRMNGEERGLGNREQMIVFPENGDVDGHRNLVPGRSPEEHELSGPNAIVRLQAPAVFAVCARSNDRLGTRSARAVELTLDEDVDALARGLRLHSEHRYDGALGDVLGPDEATFGRAQA